MSKIIIKIKEFFLKNEQKMVIFVAFCLISAISFQFGVLQGQKWQQKPLIIEKPSEVPAGQVTAQNEAPVASQTASDAKIAPDKAISATPASNTNCAYVGSKNSDKFYLPTCSYAKRVKPENLVCFKSAEQATGQGRTESKCK